MVLFVFLAMGVALLALTSGLGTSHGTGTGAGAGTIGSVTINGSGTTTHNSALGIGGTAPTGSETVSWEVVHEGDAEPYAFGESEVMDGTWKADQVLLRPGENLVTATVGGGPSTTGVIAYENCTFQPSDADHMALDEQTGVPYADNRVIVVFDRPLSEGDMGAVLSAHGLKVIGCLWGADACQAELDFPESRGLSELLELCVELESEEAVLLATIETATDADAYPNDPWTTGNEGERVDWNEDIPDGSNWGMEAIRAEAANDYASGLARHRIKVGVADSYFAGTHEDLSYQYVNPGRKQSAALSLAIASDTAKTQAERDSVHSDIDHGTHVAGIIGAVRNNGKGVSGVCDCDLLIDSVCTTSLLASFLNLVESGCKVINVSQGIHMAKSDVDNIDESMRERVTSSTLVSMAMRKMLAKRRDSTAGQYRDDFVVVQSAGNGVDGRVAFNFGYDAPIQAEMNGLFAGVTPTMGGDLYGIPAQDIYDRIVVVGNAERVPNTDDEGNVQGVTYRQAQNSNGGGRVDLCAPGTDVLSTISENGYATKSGTSMAAPHVSGAAALMWSVNPSLSGSEVKRIMCETAHVPVTVGVGAYCAIIQRPSRMLDAEAAVRAAAGHGEDAQTVSETGVQGIGAGQGMQTDGSPVQQEDASGVALGSLNRMVTSDGEYLYFAEPDMHATPESPCVCNIARMRPDGSEKVTLFAGQPTDWIYQLALSGDTLVALAGRSIITMGKDGSGAHIVASINTGDDIYDAPRFAIYGDRIYFAGISQNNAWGIDSCRLDGSDLKVLCDIVSAKIWVDVWGTAAGQVVYTVTNQQSAHGANASLYTIPTTGGEAQLQFQIEGQPIPVVGDSYYFRSDVYVYRKRADAPQETRPELAFDQPSVGSRDHVYLCNASQKYAYVDVSKVGDEGYVNGSEMWRLDLSDGSMASLGEQHYESGEMEIVGDSLYFHYGINGTIERRDTLMSGSDIIFSELV